MVSNALEHVNAPDLPEALHTMLTPIDDAVGERLTVAVAVPAAAAGEGPGEQTTATPMGTTYPLGHPCGDEQLASTLHRTTTMPLVRYVS